MANLTQSQSSDLDEDQVTELKEAVLSSETQGTSHRNVNRGYAFNIETGSVPSNDLCRSFRKSVSRDTSSAKSYQSTVQSIRGARFMHLLLIICQDEVRNLLKHYIGATDECLQRKVKEYFYKFKNLYPDQRQILTNPEYSKLDITLMHKIMTTLKFCDAIHKDKIQKELHTPCTSEAVALGRIVQQRDEFAHLPSMELDESDFDRRWEIVSESMFYIARKIDNLWLIQREVNQLRHEDFNRTEVERKRQERELLKNTFESLGDIEESRYQKNLTSLKSEDKTELEKKENERPFFFKTKAFQEAYTLLKNKGHVLLSGKEGDGRTATAYQLLIELMREVEVEVHLLDKFEKISIKPSCSTVILIDNICSDRKKITNFTRNATYFEGFYSSDAANEPHKVYLILTANTKSLNKVRFQQSLHPSCLLEREYCIDLSSLSSRDKTEILRRKIQQVSESRSSDFQDKLVESVSVEYLEGEFPIGFPFIADDICKKHIAKGAYHFLQSPFHFFKEKIDKIFQDSWEKFYVLLNIALSAEDSESQDRLEIKSWSIQKDDFKEIRTNLEEHGTYVTRQQDGSYDVTHKCIREVLKKKFLEERFEEAVKILNVDNLLQMIHIGQLMETTGPKHLVSTENERDTIATRLVTEMKNQKIQHILQHSSIWQNIEFVASFVSVPEDGAFFVDYRDEKTNNKVLAEIAAVGHTNLLMKILPRVRNDCKEAPKRQALNEALLSACQHSTKDQNKIITELVEEGANVSFCNTKGKCPLIMLMTSGTNEALLTLLKKKAIIPELKDWKFWDIIHTAAQHRDTILCNLKFMQMLYNLYHKVKDIELEIEPLWKVAQASFNSDMLRFFYSCIKYVGMEKGLLKAFFDQNLVLQKVQDGGDNVFHLVLQSENNSTQLCRIIDVLAESIEIAKYLHEENDAGQLPLAVALSNQMSKSEMKDETILVAISCGMTKANMNVELGTKSLRLCIESKVDDRIVSKVVPILLDNGGIKIDELIELAVKNSRIDSIGAMLGNRLTLPSTDDEITHKCFDYKIPPEVILKIIQVKNGINKRDANGQTPLMTAVQRCSSLHLINGLLNLGADITAIDNNGNSVLHHCFSSDFPDDLLAEWISNPDYIRQIDVEHKNNENNTAVMIAAKGVKTEATRELLKLDFNLDQTDKDGNTIIHLIIISDRNDSSILSLIDSFAFEQIHIALNCKGQTPLMIALCTHGKERLRTINRLMAMRFDVAQKDMEGRDLLRYCIESNLEDEDVSKICRNILSLGSNDCILVAFERCVQLKRSETIVVLLEFIDKGEINQAVEKLHLQCLTTAMVFVLHNRLNGKENDSEYYGIAKKILARLLSNVMNVDFATAMLQAFRETGIDMNAILDNGKTILLYAIAEKTPISLIHYIVQLGADINCRDANQSGALHLCLKSKRADEEIANLLIYLIQQGADVNVRDRYSRSPLLEAAKSGNAKAVFRLLSDICHPKINVRDNAGKTILHRIVESTISDTEVCEILDRLEKRTANGQDNGNDEHIRPFGDECLKSIMKEIDNMGLTPLNAACCNGCTSRILTILKLLQMNSDVNSLDKEERSTIYNTLRCMDRQDSKSEIERLARIAILQLYDCEPGMQNHESKLPEDMCKTYNLQKENSMLQQSHSCREMRAILAQSIERPENNCEPVTPLTGVCRATLSKDTRIERIRNQIQIIETILRGINFTEYNDEWQLSE